MDRYHEMVMFEALSERPSLASAARRLAVSGPTVVRAIARLETRLGVRLLQRSTQGVVLTLAGSAFMADCSRILKEIEDAEASARGLHVKAQGNLVVLLPLLFSRYVMTPLLANYMDAYPEVNVFAHYHDRFPNMNEEGLDVAVLVGHLPNSSLIARPVGFVRSFVCGSPAYLSAHGEPTAPEDIRNHRLVATQAFRDIVQWDFQKQGFPTSVKARSRLSCATVQAAVDATANGAGLTRCLSYPLYDYLMTGRLQRVLQPYELPALPVHVVYRERRRASMRVRSFVDFIVEGLREHPAMRPDAL
ncbi:LysR family transcriptional regulator [Pseudomonas petrae]|uniref:LysR family transcriptional regulator n=1 Tax=Pseudomonas petrae TaxID=2912190 RepID=A0ABS9I935_9PSED|nr:LysR family transcriptional regulator [Pseudomonas petrae]MCF7530981.1 LysR family transcriptional regulator [Pseudomonas petrae]MCF7536656.1 LysR family transcriptional regulator [Pseudomonas petrae]MCF7544267.1 LysR family transcriptional regulator [Pseudomonas petrae]MCF7554336.1 LysR family transcriptional regulator [Pseudomonas petrae]